MNEPEFAPWAGIGSMPSIPRSGELVPSAVVAPHETTLEKRLEVPAIGFWDLSDALISPKRPGAVTPTGYALPEPVRQAEDRPSIHSIPSVLLKHKPGWSLTRHRAGIHVSGRWPNNLYHWIVEILPKVHLARRLPTEFHSFPLLVPASAMSVAQLRESLQVLGWPGGVEVIPDGDYVHVDRMVLLDGLPSIIDDGGTPRTILHLPAAREFASEIRDRLGIHHPRASDDLVYFERPRGSRRSYNRREVGRALRRRGFRAIEPSRLTFREQVEVAAGAGLIVGPGGAAMTNLLFAQEAGVIVWATSTSREEGENIWGGIAAVGSNRFRGLAFPDAPFQRDSMNQFPYRVRIRKLIESIDGLSTPSGGSEPEGTQVRYR